ncbi:MAG: TasA family protein, partial [Patescibacteria group bacterium]
MSKVINTRILLSFVTLIAAAGVIVGGTVAFFSDTEKSAGNTLTAGAIDLRIDNTSYLNHASSSATTWELKDLTPNDLFFNFSDIKPGDEGEDTISIHVDDNDAWACMDMTLTKNDDVSCTEPEKADDPLCTDPGAPGNTNPLDGELGDLLNFVFWTDDGDNVLETHESVIASGSAGQVLDSSIVLADSIKNNVGGSAGDPLSGDKTYHIGKAWCFGTLIQHPVSGNNGISPIVDSGVLCDGSSLNNASQT